MQQVGELQGRQSRPGCSASSTPPQHSLQCDCYGYPRSPGPWESLKEKYSVYVTHLFSKKREWGTHRPAATQWACSRAIAQNWDPRREPVGWSRSVWLGDFSSLHTSTIEPASSMGARWEALGYLWFPYNFATRLQVLCRHFVFCKASGLLGCLVLHRIHYGNIHRLI